MSLVWNESLQVPVVAEPPQGEGRGDEEQDDRPRAVGE